MSLDLFSAVDFYYPNGVFLKSLAFFLSLSLLLVMISSATYKKNFSMFMLNMCNSLKKNFTKKVYYNVFSGLFLTSIFFFILFSNLVGLFPYVFGWTAHILMILVFSLFIWMFINSSKLVYDFVLFFEHYTPQSVPLFLGFFLAKIELMSKFIRPLTLSLRLGMKITTGHILLALISIISLSKILILALVAAYFLFELFVMFIQAMVYTLLFSQYLEEKI